MSTTLLVQTTSKQYTAPREFLATYGTAGYLYADIGTCNEVMQQYCKSKCGTHHWVEIDDMVSDTVQVQIISGCATHIANLVKAELEHFDTSVTIQHKG